MTWVLLTSVGTSIITSVVIEAYHQRRANERVYDYDTGMEP